MARKKQKTLQTQSQFYIFIRIYNNLILFYFKKCFCDNINFTKKYETYTFVSYAFYTSFVVSWCTVVNSWEMAVFIVLFTGCYVLLYYLFMYFSVLSVPLFFVLYCISVT